MTYPPEPPVLSGDDLTYPLGGHTGGPVNTDAGNHPRPAELGTAPTFCPAVVAVGPGVLGCAFRADQPHTWHYDPGSESHPDDQPVWWTTEPPTPTLRQQLAALSRDQEPASGS